MYDLTGKKALVTGSSQGIGKEIAKCLADHGAEVYVHGASTSEKLQAAASYVGAKGFYAADLSKVEEIKSLHQKTRDVDILILNASVQQKEKWNEISEETLDLQFTVNVKSSLLLMQDYIPAMKEKGFGRVITVGSVNQYRTHPELPAYSATKCAVMKLVECIAKDVAPFGVTVNNIAPGAIATPRNDDIYNNAEKRRAVESQIPIGRFGVSEDCVGAVLMLCSEGGTYITGTDIIIAGGINL